MSTPRSGGSLAGLKYRKYQTGANAFLTSLQFPGQYNDPETDLHENWNRNNDPSIERYLQPEPLIEWTDAARGLPNGRRKVQEGRPRETRLA